MSTEQKPRLIAELDHRLKQLKEQKSSLDSQATTLAQKRDKVNQEASRLRTEVQELRSERDKINETVKELKQQRNDTATGIKEKTSEIKKLGEQSKGLAKKKPSRSHQSLKREVESIDWKIQTTPLTLQEDKELVERVKQLESQLSVYRKIEQLREGIADLRTEVDFLRAERERCHRKLTERAQKSQEAHAKMLSKLEESRKVRTEADDLHKQFVGAKEKTKPLQEEIAMVSNKIRSLRDEIRQDEEKEKKQSEDALRQTLEKKAVEKLKRGEKLSWEEFKLLAEKGLTAQD